MDNNELSDHDLLVRLDERVEALTCHLGKHLKHHFAATMAFFTSVLGILAAVILLVFK